MKRIFTFPLFALFALSTAHAQDIETGTGFVGNGYYRVHNLATQRYVYVTDNKDYYDIARDEEDFQAIQLWKNAEKAISDPASVIYIEQIDNTTFDLTAQGTGVHSLTGYYVNVSEKTDNTYEVSATKAGVTKYLYDGKSSSAQQGTMSTTGKDISYRRWIVDKIETDHSINYVGIKPTIELNGVYYQPFYAAFPFRAVSPDMHIYYVSDAAGSYALLQEIEGDIPAKTPVLIECASPNTADNRIELLTSTTAKVRGNKLRGKRPERSRDAYKKFDAATMRLFTVENGKLILSNDAPDRINTIMVTDFEEYTGLIPADCLFANTSYYLANEFTPNTLELTDDPTSINGIAGQSTDNAKTGVYTLSGTLLRQTNDVQGLPSGLYVVGGRKIAIK